MPLPTPNLDDRRFADLVREARDRAARSCPEWTDLSVHDPGMTLIEVFAHLTEVMLYRLNRLPEKAYVEFVNLLGVNRRPPAAAWTELTFTRTGAAGQPITIPAGTRVAAASQFAGAGGDTRPVVFATTEPVTLGADDTEVNVRAHHCELVEAELLGLGTGQAGQSFTAARAPLVTTADNLDLLLGVEALNGAPPGAAAREYHGKTYQIWRPVATFAGTGPRDQVYLLDRAAGTVTFAPALDGVTAVAQVPPPGAEVRLWYRTGGGPAGNVNVDTLTVLKDPVLGVKVTNRQPARGGRALEPVSSAALRGPYEFFSVHRAVTARDFELLSTAGSGAIARAKAFTRSAMWSFAKPGEVEVVLVPDVAAQARPGWRLSAPVLESHQVDDVRQRTQRDLDERRALGTSVVTRWARCKPVSVRGKVIVRPEEDAEAVRQRIHDRLYQVISPLSTDQHPTGWAFGEPLRASNVFRILEQAEPGVRYVDEVRFVVDEAPDQRVRATAADAFQPNTWYAGCLEVLFRSTDGGQGWEPVGRFPDATVARVAPAPAPVRPGITARPGAVAVVTHKPDGSSQVHLSDDLGSTWRLAADMALRVTDIAWIDRDQAASLLLSTSSGLYELALVPNAVPLQIAVDPNDSDRGFYAVRAFVDERGSWGVALAAQAQYGVYLSTEGGRSGTYRHIGLSNVDTRTLGVQYDGPATILWVGAGEADASKPGAGCFRTRLFEANVQWQATAAGWLGGTCWQLAFRGSTILAATQSAGVLQLDGTAASPQWQAADVNGGLPLRDRTRFEPVDSIAVSPSVGQQRPVVAGGAKGVHRTEDLRAWTATANRETRKEVTIPETWLLCSGEHDIEVVPDAT